MWYKFPNKPPFRRISVLALYIFSLFFTFLSGAVLYKNAGHILSIFKSSGQGLYKVAEQDQIIRSNLYTIRVRKIHGPFTGRDGGIAPFKNGILLATRRGDFWFIDDKKAIRKLSLQVPVNLDEFESDHDVPREVAKGFLGDKVGVKDILVKHGADKFTLFASHHYWDQASNCMTLKVSKTQLSYEAISSGGMPTNNNWSTLFESKPCLSLRQENDYGALRTDEAGGRIVLLSSGKLLLSIGDHGLHGLTDGEPMTPQEVGNTYGKTISIDPESGEAKIFSIGHRNPQGLAVTSNGAIWLTEHGPTGGDELNLIEEGKNYGWPLVSYGRACPVLDCSDDNRNDLTVTLNRNLGEHEGYEKPIYSWTPSIGISNLIPVEKDLFDLWKGDLLVSSLKALTVFRVRIRNGRAVFVEPVVPVDERIRDIVEASDGSIVLKTDGQRAPLVFLQPIVGYSKSEVGGDEVVRGQILAAQCSGCHTFNRGEPHGIGPNLWGVVWRPIASVHDYEYSEALKKKGGKWSRKALEEFLRNPSSFVKSTTMVFKGIKDEEDIISIVAYLSTLQ